MSFFKIQAARLAKAMAQAREEALIERVGEVLGEKVDRAAVVQLGKDKRLTATNDKPDMPVTFVLDGKPILFVGVPKVEFTGAEISATQEIRRL